jgi:acyl-CoA-binding protein
MSTSNEIHENFKFAVEQIRHSKARKSGGPSDEERLKFYALYKQATKGPCNTPQPWVVQVVERAKWNAWNALGKMTKDKAMIEYCNLYLDTKDKYE